MVVNIERGQDEVEACDVCHLTEEMFHVILSR